MNRFFQWLIGAEPEECTAPEPTIDPQATPYVHEDAMDDANAVITMKSDRIVNLCEVNDWLEAQYGIVLVVEAETEGDRRVTGAYFGDRDGKPVLGIIARAIVEPKVKTPRARKKATSKP